MPGSASHSSHRDVFELTLFVLIPLWPHYSLLTIDNPASIFSPAHHVLNRFLSIEDIAMNAIDHEVPTFTELAFL